MATAENSASGVQPVQGAQAEAPTSKLFEVIRAQFGIKDSKDIKNVYFTKQEIQYQDAAGTCHSIEVKKVYAIFANEDKNSVVVFIAVPKKSGAVRHTLWLEGSVSGLFEIYPKGIISPNDIDSPFETEFPIMEFPENYELQSGIDRVSQLSMGGWLPGGIMLAYLQAIVTGNKDLLGDTKAIVLENVVCDENNIQKRAEGTFKKVNLFDHDIIAIPLHVGREHWCLLVVCYPGLDRAYNIDTGEPYEMPKPFEERLARHDGLPSCSNASLQCGLQDIKRYLESGKAPTEKVRVKQPCILIFDSSGNHYTRDCLQLVKNLIQFLTCRQLVEGRSSPDFNKVKVDFPRVPKQPNLGDCGIFTLHFLYEFLKFFKSDKFDLDLPLQIDLSTMTEGMSHTREYLTSYFLEKNPDIKFVGQSVSGEGFYVKIPERDDFKLPENYGQR